MNKRIHACLAAFLLLPALAYTQQAAPTANPELKLRPAPAPEQGRIQLDVVVTNKAGKPVSGLELKNFTLLDDKQPTRIISFRAIDADVEQTAPPAKVILLLDAVNLGYLALAQARDEVAKFLRQNGGHLAQPVSVALFTDDGVKILLQPSTDGNALAAQLDKARATFRAIGRSGGVNGDSERFNLSLKWLINVATAEARGNGRTLLVWVGPGWPMLNQANTKTSPQGLRVLFDHAVDVSTTLREVHVAVYSVSLGSPGLNTDIYESYLKGVRMADRIDSANLALKVIAVRAGGWRCLRITI